MKYALLKLLLFLPLFSFAQNYISLDSIKSHFDVKEYHLKTQPLYSSNKIIEVYNVNVDSHTLLLLSVLPPLENNENWEVLEDKNYKEKLISTNKVIKIAAEWSMNNKPEDKTFAYKLTKQVNGITYCSKNCLTELFTLQNMDLPLASSYGTINLKETKSTVSNFYKVSRKQFPNDWFIMDPRNDFRVRENYSYYPKYYQSNQFQLKNLRAYKFWTFDGWWVTDGLNEHRGIDRFIYIPNKGIVGGSYDFWFSKNETPEKLWDDIINEKIMIAEEFK